jgi:hypothetical protein
MNTLTLEEQENGWLLMFDGNTTNGWRGYNKKAFPEKGWVIEEGTLKCNGSVSRIGGDIIYDTRFRDFELSIEWKISKGGNSGIFYLAEEIPGLEIWRSAPEFQILDNKRHPDALLGKHGNRQTASLYDLIPAVPQNAKPAGEWNTTEIHVNRGKVCHFMNGEKVVEYHIDSTEWKEMISVSKFQEFPEFGNYREGFIGLQDHGDDVWFRNIKIRKPAL